MHRTFLWLAGMAVLFVVTNGGLHIYQGYLFNAHVLTQMSLTAVVPLLLVPAAPLTLAELAVRPRTDGSTGAREILLRTVRPLLTVFKRDPLICIFLLAACLFASYYTPLLEWSAGGQLGYSAATLLALSVGCLVTAALTGAMAPETDRPPGRRWPVVAGLAGLYAYSGWKLSTQATELERPWYTSVGQPWGSSLLAAADVGGAIMWTIAAASLAAMTLGLLALKRGAGSLPADMVATGDGARDVGQSAEPAPHPAPAGTSTRGAGVGGTR